MAINLRGVMFATQASLATMRRQGYGRVVVTSSITGSVVGQPGYTLYGASKAAMVSLMKTVALENGDADLTANVILPGTMDTHANRKAMPGADFSKWVQPASIASTWAPARRRSAISLAGPPKTAL